jgi:hypothetical protein
VTHATLLTEVIDLTLTGEVQVYAAAFEPTLGPQEAQPAGYNGGLPERSSRPADTA